MAMNDDPIKACGLWQRVSAKGRTYFAGRLGGLKVLVFENSDRKGENEPSHWLMFGEAPERGERRSSEPEGRS
jgi:hypothetical protein